MISIHVPAWGTTTFFAKNTQKLTAISIHVPAWGTTGFNKTLYHMTKISIHVPAWGTTYSRFLYLMVLNYFNPRSRVGNDLKTGQR